MILFDRLRALLGLYRLDVAFITFCAALAGPYFSRASFTLSDVGMALFVSLVIYHYVYALNAITDREEDAVNHPSRPLPAGRISVIAAARHVAFLAVVSVAGTILLFEGRSLFLALLVVLLGTLYSARPFAFKRYPLAAALLTAWGLVHPFFITADPAVGWRGLSFIPIAAGAVLFKDLADARGDDMAGRHTLAATAPLGVMCAVSLVLFAGGAVLLWQVELRIAMPLPVVLAGVLLWHLLFLPLVSWREVIYNRLIRGALASLALVALSVVGGMLSW